MKERVIIFANGDVDPQALESVRQDDFILCADGGALNAVRLGLTPDVILGDFDSLSDEILQDFRHQGITIIKYPMEKDKTDLELAMDYAIELGATEIVVFTALGGRMDQMLGNVLLATQENYKSARIAYISGLQTGYILRDENALELYGMAGDILSVIPLSPEVHVKALHGVVWPLDNEVLEFGSSLSLSNRFAENLARIVLKSGICMVVHIPNGH